MKNFALQPISVQAKSQSLVFILCNLYQIAEAGTGFDGGGFSIFVNLMWGFSLSAVIIGQYELTKEQVPEFWKTGSAILATVVLLAKCLEVTNPEIDTTAFYFFFFFNLLFGSFTTEGIYKPIYLYLTAVAALCGLLFTGADIFFDYSFPESLQPLFLLIGVGFTVGVGYGNYDAWNKK